VRPQDTDLEVPGIGDVPREALDDHAAERVHVRASVDHVALDVLGGDVVDRPDELPCGRETAHR
jgi:hypothetical protein